MGVRPAIVSYKELLWKYSILKELLIRRPAQKWFSYFFNFLSCRWCQEGCLLRWISQIIRKVLSVLAVLLPINFERVEKSVLKEFTVLNGSVSSGSINFQMDQFFRKLTLSCIILKNGHSYFKTILLCEQLWF